MIRSVGTVLVLLVSALDAGAQSPSQAISTYDTGVGHGNPTVPTAQSELPNSLSGVVLTWGYYAQAKTVVFHALNNSGKDITGYSIVIHNKLPDGTMDKGGWSASASDMLWALVRMQMAKDAGEERIRNDIFIAGTTRDTNVDLVLNMSEDVQGAMAQDIGLLIEVVNAKVVFHWISEVKN